MYICIINNRERETTRPVVVGGKDYMNFVAFVLFVFCLAGNMKALHIQYITAALDVKPTTEAPTEPLQYSSTMP